MVAGPRNQWNHKVRGAEIQAPLLKCARCARVLLDGCPLGHSDHTVRLCLFPFAALALYCALLCTLLLIAEQICIALEHARGFVAGDLHAIVHRTASFPYLMRSTPPKVVEDSSDVRSALPCFWVHTNAGAPLKPEGSKADWQ